MNSIAVCIPTYKRIQGLKKLLQSINNCEIDQSLIEELHIVIVDNDIKNSAFNLVSNLAKNELNDLDLSYFHYPTKGLAKVRNELLRRAFEKSPDFIVFIDDDEFAEPKWLNELVLTILNNQADLVMGPVLPVFERAIPNYISKWFYRKSHKNNERLDYIRSGNLVIRTQTLKNLNIWFDSRFDDMGGEDSYFGKKMSKNGALIYWSANAVTYETTSSERARLSWILKRKFRGAFIFTYILKIENEFLMLFKKICISLIYLFVGLVTSLIALLPIRERFWGIMKLSEALGALSSLFSPTYKAYD
ncbi:glycosyltransferase family 2 protein [Flavimarina sp. Hel_I_48]|uniref:glycosyltransferase family 2 protein n=1 Tax=Flavimarina sp. Hel_I_48 TaxID=1392488 RepID=UPI0004DF4ECD|nr:glycosyltransferase [Flavimarina sp. Hel_I_48]